MKVAFCVLASNPPEILSDIFGEAVFSFSELSQKLYSFKYDETVIPISPGDPVICQVRSSYCYGKVVRVAQGNSIYRVAKYKPIIAKLNPATLLDDIKAESVEALLTRESRDEKFSQRLLQVLGELGISPATLVRRLKNAGN